MTRFAFVSLILAASTIAQAQKATKAPPVTYSGPPTTSAISAQDAKTRLYKFAADSMMGRLAGTPYNDKGTDYIASELKRLKLEPLGEDGTYFQNALVRRELEPGAFLEINGTRYDKAWADFAPRDQGDGARAFDGAQVIYGGRFEDTASFIDPALVAGKIVVMQVGRDSTGKIDFNRVNRPLATARYNSAAAIAVAQIDYVPPGYIAAAYQNAGVSPRAGTQAPAAPTFFYITNAIADAMFGKPLDQVKSGETGGTVRGQIKFSGKSAPGRNVIALLRGTDPKLKGQYVVFGAHNDHVGFNRRPAEHDSIKALMMHAAPQGADSPQPKPTPEQWIAINKTIDSLRAIYPARSDSIYNGADDDGSGSMGLLEIAEYYASGKVKPKRSILFVWHVAEELGLFGAAYFTQNPTVPRDSIVAQLNMDMIGRGGAHDATGEDKAGKLLYGGPGYVQLIGSRRLSTELGDLAETVNKKGKFGLKFDYALDANGHPQNIYCRSDHYMYARFGIPIIFFTTGGHADYHQVTDEPQYIDYDRLSLVSRYVAELGRTVANLDHRVVVDQPKPNPYGACRQ